MGGHTKQRAQRKRKSVLAYDGHPGIDGGTHWTEKVYSDGDRWRDTQNKEHKETEKVYSPTMDTGIEGGTHKTKSTKKQKKCTRLRWTSRDRRRDTQNKEHKETEKSVLAYDGHPGIEGGTHKTKSTKKQKKVYSPTMDIQG